MVPYTPSAPVLYSNRGVSMVQVAHLTTIDMHITSHKYIMHILNGFMHV